MIFLDDIRTYIILPMMAAELASLMLRKWNTLRQLVISSVIFL